MVIDEKGTRVITRRDLHLNTDKINRFRLVDDTDNYFSDNVYLKRDYQVWEITEVIQKCKDEVEDYTNEDIYKYLEKYLEVDYIEFINSYIEY